MRLRGGDGGNEEGKLYAQGQLDRVHTTHAFDSFSFVFRLSSLQEEGREIGKMRRRKEKRMRDYTKGKEREREREREIEMVGGRFDGEAGCRRRRRREKKKKEKRVEMVEPARFLSGLQEEGFVQSNLRSILEFSF